MITDDIVDLSAVEIATRVINYELSALEVSEAFVGRVKHVNPALNAIICFDPNKVKKEACDVDRQLACGTTLPLAGVPFTVKDNFWVKDVTSSQGSRRFQGFVAPADAIAVARLRLAGGVFLGITNCSEFACKGVTTNLLYGATRNPWDLTRTPGGSSGGAASAIAAGLGALALGSDAGGSVRRPAAHVGAVGMKPTGGLVPHSIGFSEPVFGHNVVGQMGRNVSDVARCLNALAGPDQRDPMTPPMPVFDLNETFNAAALKNLRIAYSPRLGLGFPVDPDVAETVHSAVSRLADSGARIEYTDPEWPPDTSEETLLALQFAGLASLYGAALRNDPEQFDPDIASQIEKGLTLRGTQVTDALLLRQRMYEAMSKLFAKYDLLITPTTPVTAWKLPDAGPAIIEGVPVSSRGHAVFTPHFNHTYLPACSVPCGLANGGLPVGAQVIGPRFSDARILATAAIIERHTARNFSQIVTPHE